MQNSSGINAVIRKVRAEDVEGFLALEGDPEIHEMFGGSRETYLPTTREAAEATVKRVSDHPFAWVIEHEFRVIGEARLDRVDGQDRRASFAIGILDPRCLGKGIGTDAMRLVLRFAFEQLKLHRISVRVLACNHRLFVPTKSVASLSKVMNERPHGLTANGMMMSSWGCSIESFANLVSAVMIGQRGRLTCSIR
ncbi:GNAT family N-acetyltransferase [Bradyrhizobium jicamae]|uniref:GNAT family N-acetyltransferase n=1 Tax=Bradyrhizobium jicamae TaxID=280332 RepID=UPI000A8504A9